LQIAENFEQRMQLNGEYFREQTRTLDDLHEELKQRIVDEYCLNNAIDFCFRKNKSHVPGCECPFCNYDYEGWVLYWKEEGNDLQVVKIMMIVDLTYFVFHGMREPIRQELRDFPEWGKWENNPIIINALDAMRTKKWSKNEQTEEAWDKNKEVY
jgi:hypothetical protein